MLTPSSHFERSLDVPFPEVLPKEPIANRRSASCLFVDSEVGACIQGKVNNGETKKAWSGASLLKLPGL